MSVNVTAGTGVTLVVTVIVVAVVGVLEAAVDLVSEVMVFLKLSLRIYFDSLQVIFKSGLS